MTRILCSGAAARCGALLFSFILFAPPARAQVGVPEPPPPRPEPEALADLARRFQGTWVFMGVERGGLIDAQPGRQDYLVIQGNDFQRYSQGQLLDEGTFKITSVGPQFATTVSTVTKGANPGEQRSAIFRIDNDRLQYCYGPPGAPPPTRLATANQIGITNTFDKRGVTAINLQGYSAFGRANGEVGNRDNTWQLDEELTHNMAPARIGRTSRGYERFEDPNSLVLHP